MEIDYNQEEINEAQEEIENINNKMNKIKKEISQYENILQIILNYHIKKIRK